MTSIWTYRDTTWIQDADIVGYDVEALDGDIGKVDASSYDADSAHIVVDTGWWIFGKKRLIPAGAVTAIDHDQKRVAVQLTKDQIKSAPDFDEARGDVDDRAAYDEYYGPFGW